MLGPKPKGTWTGGKAPNCGPIYRSLTAGQRYRVVIEFRDHDGHTHPVGEVWTFLGYSFLPYDDGLSFFVSLDNEHEWHIPLQWRTEEQGEILDNLQQYVTSAT
jgi:hypothetical protein